MARWCPQCGRPKEEHGYMPLFKRGSPLSRVCNLIPINNPGSKIATYRAFTPKDK